MEISFRRGFAGLIIGAALIGGFAWWQFFAREPAAAPPVRQPLAAEQHKAPALREDSASTNQVAAADPRAAQLTIDGRQHAVVPNARGEFSRVRVPASAAITAKVPFPDAPPGAIIAVQTEDGGELHGAAAQGRLALDAGRRANVEFKASASDGLQRVTLRRGGETRVLEFWVGAEPPVVVRN